MDTKVILQALPEIVTQLLGFLLVFWILKKYVFTAILSVIDERRKAIADTFKAAESKKADLESLEAEYRARLQNIEQEARSKIQKAVEDGSRLGQEIKEKARQDALKLSQRAKADIEQELAKAKTVLRDDIVSIATHMAERVIRKKLDDKENQAYVRQILNEVENG